MECHILGSKLSFIFDTIIVTFIHLKIIFFILHDIHAKYTDIYWEFAKI